MDRIVVVFTALMSATGHCLCGGISYAFEGEPVAVLLCHCDDCQRGSGAAFSVNVIIARAGLEIDGAPRVHHTTAADSANGRERHFCGDCGSPMFTMLAEQPDLAIVKAGTLDDRSRLAPAVEIWCSTAQDWLATAAERPTFARDLQAG